MGSPLLPVSLSLRSIVHAECFLILIRPSLSSSSSSPSLPPLSPLYRRRSHASFPSKSPDVCISEEKSTSSTKSFSMATLWNGRMTGLTWEWNSTALKCSIVLWTRKCVSFIAAWTRSSELMDAPTIRWCSHFLKLTVCQFSLMASR